VPLRRADRPFDIIRILRAASQPVTAAALRSMMLAFDESSSHVATKTTDLTTARAFNGVSIAVTATVGVHGAGGGRHCPFNVATSAAVKGCAARRGTARRGP
jgi:hypothetical protein